MGTGDIVILVIINVTMSIKALQDLIEANPEALTKVQSAANHAEVSEIAKGYGIEVTPAEILRYAAQQTAELDDDALEAIAGGAWSATDVGTVGLGVATAVGIDAATAGVGTAAGLMAAGIVVK